MEYITISRVALKAHNRNAEEPGYNDSYNRAHALGTMQERRILRSIANDLGLFGTRAPLTPAKIATWREVKDNNRLVGVKIV